LPRDSDLALDILSRFSQIQQWIRQAPLNLGGSSGSGGGSGAPVGGFTGQLPQIRVAGDTSESFLNTSTSGSISSLLDNLKNLRAYAKASHQFWATSGSPPIAAITISSGSWHHTSGQAPLAYIGGQTPAIVAPSSGSRFSLLTTNTNGVLSWTYGAEGNPPSMLTFPSPTSGSMPLWLILARSSGSVITQYDRGLLSHYIYRDVRPFLDWGIGGAGSSGSSGHIIRDESVSLTQRQHLNFTGAGVSATDNAITNSTDITISGAAVGGSSGSVVFRWHVDGPIAASSDIQGIHYISASFNPSIAHLYLKGPPTSGSVIVDAEKSTDCISWTSIFGTKPTLTSGSCATGTPLGTALSVGTLLRAKIENPGTGAYTLTFNLSGTVPTPSASDGGGGDDFSAMMYAVAIS